MKRIRKTSKGSSGVLRRSGHLHHHSLAEGKLQQLRGRRSLRRRRPGHRAGRPGGEGHQDPARPSCTVLDLKKDYVENYIWPCLKADAKYEDYLLGTSHARPCIAAALAEIAKKENADAICHGCTGKGNDQVRFELTLKALAPDMAIIAPWREWSIKSRDEEIDYAEAHNIPLKINRETNYSKDKNLWHLSHEGLDLEKPSLEPQYNKPGFLELGVSPEQAPDTPTYVTIHFEKGIPTAVDGKEMESVELVEYLNKLGGANGIGLLDIVENRLVGMKSRGVYETPGGAILYKAHDVLETITLDKESMHFKAQLAQKMGELVYNGQWFTPLREAISAFTDDLQKTVTGDVKLKLYKGNMVTPVSPARTPCTMSRPRPSVRMTITTRRMPPVSSTCSACPLPSAPSWPRAGPHRTNKRTNAE